MRPLSKTWTAGLALWILDPGLMFILYIVVPPMDVIEVNARGGFQDN